MNTSQAGLSDKAKYTRAVSIIHADSNIIWASFTPPINCHDWNVRPAALYTDLTSDCGIMRCFRVYPRWEEQAVTARSVTAMPLISLDLESLLILSIARYHERFGFGILTPSVSRSVCSTQHWCAQLWRFAVKIGIFVYYTPETHYHNMAGMLLCLF